jgi:hypothetical protein
VRRLLKNAAIEWKLRVNGENGGPPVAAASETRVSVMRNLFSRFERALSGMPAVLIGVAASLTSIAIIVGVKSIDSGAPFN